MVISHNHYDHLCYPTIKKIEKAFPGAQFFVPLGNKQWFLDSGIQGERVTELDWWDSRDIKLTPGAANKKDGEVESRSRKVSVTSSEGNQESAGGTESILATIGALPCQHGSARGPFDRCKALWASWSIESGGAKVYFAGYDNIPFSS